MPVNALFRDDFYLSTAEAIVTAVHEDGGIEARPDLLLRHVRRPAGRQRLSRAGRWFAHRTRHYQKWLRQERYHPCAAGRSAFPEVGEKLTLHVDWPRRYKLMRMHTACHLLSVVCQWPITGAAVGEDESRVDFDMSETIDKDEVTAKLMELVKANHPVFLQWITDEELQANPGIVKSKNVRPPIGLGRVSLVCIGENSTIDSQPCGGTHVSETQEVGDIHIAKIEKKGKENRRFRIRFGTPEAAA